MGPSIFIVGHLPSPAYSGPRPLVKSLRSPPSSFFSEITEWLHALVQLLRSPHVSLQHTAPVPIFPVGGTRTELGMHLAHSYAHTGIPPLFPGFPAHPTPLMELSFTIHPLADCFPVGALQDSCSWRDLFTGEPLLVPLEQRVQCLRRIQAQRGRDQNRAQRLGPPIWEDVT